MEKLNKESLMAGIFGEIPSGGKEDKKSSRFNLDKVSFAPEGTTESTTDIIVMIPVDKLVPYPNNNFRKLKGEKWTSFVESIRIYGILEPIRVRRHPTEEGHFQILAGHNRTEGAKEAGLYKVPAIVKEMDDVDASVLMGVSNRQREDVSDIEWGWTYRNTYELMKRQGERNDLTSSQEKTKLDGENHTCAHDEHKLDDGENQSCAHDEHKLDDGENQSCAHDEHKLNDDENQSCAHDEHKLKGKKTLDILAEKYGESRVTIQRKIRLTYLIESLVELLENKKLTQAVAIDLSYLTEVEQDHVYAVIFSNKVKIDPVMAKDLKTASKEAKEAGTELDINAIFNIMVPADKLEKKEKRDNEKVSVPNTYFPEGLKKKEKADYVLKALKYIQENEIKL